MARRIALSQGKYALVDDADYEWLNQWKWTYHSMGSGAAARKIKVGKGKQASVLMHRLILDASDGMHVDHINGDGLDNRRENLRQCTPQQNWRNRKPANKNGSGYKGAYPNKNHWEAAITVNRQRLYLGCFGNPEDAARAYDEAAREHFGKYARLNFPTS